MRRMWTMFLLSSHISLKVFSGGTRMRAFSVLVRRHPRPFAQATYGDVRALGRSVPPESSRPSSNLAYLAAAAGLYHSLAIIFTTSRI